LGKWISNTDNYIIDAQELQVGYFNLGDWGWKLSNYFGDPWLANQGFLDKVLQRGIPIYLGQVPVAATDTYARELEYLFERGVPNELLIPAWGL
jgi:hypothetical protein